MIKRKKNSRQRGSHTHGWGSKKKHRGAGNRGGRGKAGSGKRGDAKKPSYWKIKKREGKHGFKSRKKKGLAINIEKLDKVVGLWVKEGKAKYTAGAYEVNLKDLKIEKLLGSGKTKKVFKIIVEKASEKAKQKIVSAKGAVEVIQKKEEKTIKESKKEEA